MLTLLAGPGVVWELAFGSWVLLQLERISAHAQAAIRTLQADEHQRGCFMEERVLKDDQAYESSMPRLAGDEARSVLLAMHRTLVEPSTAAKGLSRLATRYFAPATAGGFGFGLVGLYLRWVIREPLHWTWTVLSSVSP